MAFWPKFFSEKNRFEKRRRALIFFWSMGAVLMFCVLVALLLYLLQSHRPI